jgi:hypothetical protein
VSEFKDIRLGIFFIGLSYNFFPVEGRAKGGPLPLRRKADLIFDYAFGTFRSCRFHKSSS